MKTIPRMGAIGASVALAAAVLFAVVPAGAETHDISSNLGGSLTIIIPSEDGPIEAGLAVPDGSTFVGDYDDDSGVLTGAVSIEDGTATVEIAGLGEAGLAFSFESEGEIEDGTIDDQGNVSFTDTQTLTLTTLTIGDNPPTEIPDTCKFGPIAFEYTGTYDGDTSKVNVTSAPLPIPLGNADCGDLTGAIVGVLGEATVKADLQFSIAVEDITPPTTTTVPAEEPTEPTPPAKPSDPAAPVTAKPTYTG